MRTVAERWAGVVVLSLALFAPGVAGSAPESVAGSIEAKLEECDRLAEQEDFVAAFAALDEAMQMAYPEGGPSHDPEAIVVQKIVVASAVLIAREDWSALRAVLNSERISRRLKLQVVSELEDAVRHDQ